MKKLTNKQKIAILKKMRAELKREEINCFCWAYRVATKFVEGCEITVEKVIALGLKKPIKKFGHGYWYDFTNQTIRIKKIDQLIKKLSK